MHVKGQVSRLQKGKPVGGTIKEGWHTGINMVNVISLFGDKKPEEKDVPGDMQEIVSFLKTFAKQIASGKIQKGFIVYEDIGGLNMRALGPISGWGEMMLMLKAVEKTVLDGYITDIEDKE